jgi:pSer/pThr/pTyr-binding forkhead associated (FHA) protein
MAEWHVMLNDRTLDKFWIEEGDTINIGRGKTAEVSIDNSAVSRQHARLEMRNGKYLLTDLKSANGTFVNGRKIKDTVRVVKGDRVQIGKFRFALVRDPKQGASPFEMVRDPKLTASPPTPADFNPTVFIAPKRLAVIKGKTTPEHLSLKGKDIFSLGKDATCDMRIAGRHVAKTQCHILAKGGEHYLVHHAGWRRTTLNGQKIRGEEKLRSGDTIGIGGTKIRFE